MNLPNDQDSASNASSEGPREVQPMEVDVFRIVLVGTALYAVAFLIMLPLRTSLENAGHGRWPWIALSGFVLGLMGLVITYRRARRLQKRDDQ
jgi:hypothetical protein